MGKKNVFPVKKYESRCLIISSTFFLIPGMYALTMSFYFYAVVSILTALVSANYWRHAIEGPRKTADLITAKCSFAVYFVSISLTQDYIISVCLVGCFGILLFYWLSNRAWNADSSDWIYFHMIFHLLAASEQFIILFFKKDIII